MLQNKSGFRVTLVVGAIVAISASTPASASTFGVRIIEQIDFPSASLVQVRGINNAGDLVGYRAVGGVNESFVRAAGGFEFFQVDGAGTSALALNDTRTTVGGVTNPGPPAGADSFIRQADGATVRFQPGNNNTAGNGINNAGVVVGSGNLFNFGGYVRATNGTVTGIDYVGGAGETILKTNATDVNNAGLIVGHAIGQAGPDFFGRGWYSSDDGATFTTVTRPGEQFTYLWAGNDAGLLVGDFSTGFTGNRTGFVYDIASGQFSPFTVPGANWTVPTGINDVGEIAGFSRDAATGRITGFVAVVPEPASLSLLSGVGVLALRRRRIVR